MACKAAFNSTADDNNFHNDFVPLEQMNDTISKIEAWKAANADVYLFMPSWADDNYFMQLYTPKRITTTALEITMANGETVLNKEAENGHSVTSICSEFVELDMKTKDVSPNIVDNAASQAVIVQKVNQVEASLRAETNASIAFHAAPMKPDKSQELKHKTKAVQNTGELAALEIEKDCHFIPRKLFLSSVQTFKLAPETRLSTTIRPEKTKPVKPKRFLYKLPCITGISPMEESRVVRPRRSWRDRVLRFLGLKR